MAGFLKLAQQLAQRGTALDGDDIGPRHHHVLDAQCAEPQQIAKHEPLLRREARVLALLLLEHLFDELARVFAVSAKSDPCKQARQPAFVGPRTVLQAVACHLGRVRCDRGLAHFMSPSDRASAA